MGVFADSNPLTDGMHNFAASLINAPIAARQLEQQNQQQNAAQQLAQAWKQKEFDRQDAQNALAATWKEAEMKRQTDRDAGTQKFQDAQIANLDADNTRQNWSMLGNGANNAASRAIDAIKLLFHGNGSKGSGNSTTNGGTGWHKAEDGTWFSRGVDGTTEVFDPATKTRLTYDPNGKVIGGTPEAPPPASADPGVGILDRIKGLFGGTATTQGPVAPGQEMPPMPSSAPPATGGDPLQRIMSAIDPTAQQKGLPSRPDWLHVDPMQEKRKAFVQMSGIDPHPSSGIDLADILGTDEKKRIDALKLFKDPSERKRAIEALRTLGHK
jgi:hypothetical protein